MSLIQFELKFQYNTRIKADTVFKNESLLNILSYTNI